MQLRQRAGIIVVAFPKQKKSYMRDPAVPRLPYTRETNIDQIASIIGRIFSFPSKLPWEFTVEHPIRSIFPLWAIYELPMSLLKWFYTEIGSGSAPPNLVYYALRSGMFLLSFVLEDWAIYELVPSPRHRRATVVLVASSYVTWTYQTHTFSNSLETLLVAWGLVLIRRIVENKVREQSFRNLRFELI
jgi:phosphatidylinositol glycan class Z